MSPRPLILILSLQYLLTYGVLGVLLPFAPVILTEQGLSDREMSLALSSLGIAALLSPIIIGHIADTRVKPQTLILFLLFLSGIELPLWLGVHNLLTATFAVLM